MRLPIVAVCMLATLLLATPLGTAAATPKGVVSAASTMGLAGGTNIPVPVSLRSLNGAQVVAMNFDLTFDSSRLAVVNVTIGSAASGADKSLSWLPQGANRIRVVVVGLNQDAIPNGAVAVVNFNVLAGSRPGATPLVLTGVVASDPTTLPIPMAVVNGAFRVVTRLR